jgi:pyruvate,water dikinase
MRWEEIWDAALRIRTLFNRTAWPVDLGAALREGIPCVTGVPDAVYRIRTGDTVSVDGYVGIVTRFGHEASCDMPGAARR